MTEFTVYDRMTCRKMGRNIAHLVEVAEAACECRSDLAAHKAANTETYKQKMNHSHMWAYSGLDRG